MGGEDVTNCVLNFLNGGSFLESINYTYIVLIPKIKKPLEITQFRPISLCNVIYKIISKVLANRLKILLPNIISASQSAFVLRRQITNNNGRRHGWNGWIAMKLDMSKTYDRVEWKFLEDIMRKMGFARS